MSLISHFLLHYSRQHDTICVWLFLGCEHLQGFSFMLQRAKLMNLSDLRLYWLCITLCLDQTWSIWPSVVPVLGWPFREERASCASSSSAWPKDKIHVQKWNLEVIKPGISSQTVPNLCLSSAIVDIYFGLWRTSLECLAPAKDAELVGKFQPQYAAWWPIYFALIFSFLIGMRGQLVQCSVEGLGLIITFLSARGTKSLPTKEQ